jgi:hypothetical protein
MYLPLVNPAKAAFTNEFHEPVLRGNFPCLVTALDNTLLHYLCILYSLGLRRRSQRRTNLKSLHRGRMVGDCEEPV